ncbi:MAG: hypoxanthine phosphoribosyltransferase [Heliobacteriaceae bacterium]|jgi:hypoxanthine phosphoribosyltransferase|nr:hypoxanthine phosphoribosyltransferase [Heliobacteriaceae bacterium]
MKIKTLFGEEEIQNRVAELAEEMNKFYNGREVYVIVVLKGAVVFAADLIRHFNMPVKTEFIRLSSYGANTASSGKVHAVDIALPDLNGKNVLIIEDIIDTGLTAKFLLDFIGCNFKTKSTKFCSFLDKKTARVNDIEPDYFCFEVDDKFVIGYGLDYNGNYRNLPYVGYIQNV